MDETISVRREEITSSTSTAESRSPSPATRAQLQGRLSILYGQSEDGTSDPSGLNPLHRPKDDGEDEEYAFRLFAPRQTPRLLANSHLELKATDDNTDGKQGTSERNTTESVRIRVRSPSLDAVNGPFGFVTARSSGYYFTSPPSPHTAEQLKKSAVSGETVQAWSLRSWPGCALPWRVQCLDAQSDRGASIFTSAGATEAGEDRSGNRRRLGKKRRIALRRRAQRRTESQLKTRLRQDDKEAAAKEKRTRLNRAKNVRRRAKEKAKKATQKEGE